MKKFEMPVMRLREFNRIITVSESTTKNVSNAINHLTTTLNIQRANVTTATMK